MTKALSICILLCLAGCNMAVEPSETEAERIAEHLTYIKDRHGICYAAVSSVSYGFNQVASIATVPCERVGL